MYGATPSPLRRVWDLLKEGRKRPSKSDKYHLLSFLVLVATLGSLQMSTSIPARKRSLTSRVSDQCKQIENCPQGSRYINTLTKLEFDSPTNGKPKKPFQFLHQSTENIQNEANQSYQLSNDKRINRKPNKPFQFFCHWENLNCWI